MVSFHRLESIQKHDSMIEKKQQPHQRMEEGSFIKLPDYLIYLISIHTTHFFDY